MSQQLRVCTPLTLDSNLVPITYVGTAHSSGGIQHLLLASTSIHIYMCSYVHVYTHTEPKGKKIFKT